VLSRITDFSSSPWGKWIVIAVWLLVAAILIPLSPMIADVTNNDSETFLPEGAESTEVRALVEERFPSDTTPAIVVFHNPDGLADDERAVAEELGRWAQSNDAPEALDGNSVVSMFTVPQASAQFVSADGTTMTMVIGVAGDPNSNAFLDAVSAIREEAEAREPDGVTISVSGPGGLTLDLISVFQQIDVFLTLVTAVLVLILLVLIYRSPIMPFVPLLAVSWVFILAGAVAANAAERFGLLVNGQAQGIMTVLLFGAGTDYCLFIASRFREELRRREDKHEAMRVAMRAVGGAISSSAATVLVATFILAFATLRSTAALGPLLTIAIALMLLAGLTLVPAIITALGRAAFWPARPVYDPGAGDDQHAVAHGLWGRIATAVTSRPRFALVSSVAVFGLLSLGLFQYQVTYDSITSLPEGTEALRLRVPPRRLPSGRVGTDRGLCGARGGHARPRAA
jgi:putative drug exporter of the RND superfamily